LRDDVRQNKLKPPTFWKRRRFGLGSEFRNSAIAFCDTIISMSIK